MTIRRAGIGACFLALAVAGVLWWSASSGPSEGTVTAAPPPTASSSTSTSTSTSSPVAPTSEPAATVASASTTTTTTAPPPPRFTMDPYRGLGAWVDVFDWSVTFDRTPDDPPSVGLAEIDRMASLGVRTLYLQPARFDSPLPGVVEPEQVDALIERARGHGMDVVGWYLPTMQDTAYDLAQIAAVAALPIDGLGIDIESTLLADEAERNRRVVAISAEVRARHPDDVISAIVLPPVVTNVYGTYWGTFPWAELAPYYDVWQPMGYWTMRSVASGWRDAYTYTAANIDLLRSSIGNPDGAVHPVGGIGCCEGPTAPTRPSDVDAMLRAARERGALGASLYDYVTTGDDLWTPLAAANEL